MYKRQHFRQIPILAVFVNVIAAPLLGLILLLAVPTLLLALGSSQVASFLASLLTPALRLSLVAMRRLCVGAADLPLATARVGLLPRWEVVAWSAGLAGILAWGLIYQVKEEGPGR